MELLYLEDLSAGMRFESGSFAVDEEDMKRFAQQFDPQPFHLDEEAGRSTFFGGLVASGWYTAAITMRLWTSGGLPFACGVIGMGGEIGWLKPVRAGDVLRVVSTIVDVTTSKSKQDRGIVAVSADTLNEAGDVVFNARPRFLVFARPR
ncbi:MaoC family dehydratase [Paraburkholderia phytofirmans]|uniref:Dehydratase n=1 Tax=Paraburkholderia phytofirmans OLGA172 TaxID=1417228 RepID=A0A160FSK3_9BURK|nr:MaoC family dehydratase [Paraburkholderia phytofirmans]ANB76049.1 dehydratase [Paraburkholderia phytofirmans OLGA172]